MNHVVQELPVPIAVFLAAIDDHLIASIADASGAIIYANPRFCEVSGYALPELIGQNHRLLKSGRHPDTFYQALWATISTGKVWHGEVCNRAKDGSEYWVKSTITPVLDGNGIPTHYISVRTDITEQKTSAEAVFALANELAELFKIAPVGIARLESRYFDKVNDVFAHQLGYEPEELLGQETRMIYFSDEEYVAIGQAAYGAVIAKGVFTGELCLRKKDGSQLWGLAGLASLTPEDPLHNTLYVIQDITEHRNLEKNLSTALARSELAKQAKQEFLNNMSHQMHTPLNGILGVLQILAMDELAPEQKMLTDEALAAANNLLHMLDRSLEYVGLDTLANSAKSEQCSISECVDLLLYQADGLARKQGVEIVREIPDALNEQVFSSDHAKFRQMLGLIIDNAIRYNRPNGKVSLAVNQAVPGSLVFTVTDTGCGLSEDQLKALGEPFVRYGETERIAGTGLGLALAYRLATLLGAEISVSSVPGAGTVFSVKLPL